MSKEASQEEDLQVCKHSNLDKLKEVMSDFVAALDKEEVRRAVRDFRPWAGLCTKMNLGHFESQLQKYKKGTIEE